MASTSQESGQFWDQKIYFVQHKEFPFEIRKILKH